MVSSRVFLLGIYFTFGATMFVSQARYHYHHHKKHKRRHESQISIPPSPPPEASGPSPDQNWSGVYDVRMFGAAGDGETDDTEAFKSAWDTACQVESAVLLVPSGYSFMIQSTIFTGPCQGGFVFQVLSLYVKDFFETLCNEFDNCMLLVSFRRLMEQLCRLMDPTPGQRTIAGANGWLSIE